HLIMATATLMGMFAATYLWYPKLVGRLLDRRLGLIHFVGTLVLSVVTFGGQLVAGAAGQLRRLHDAGQWQTFADLADLNRWTGFAAFGRGAVQLVFFANLWRSRHKGAPAGPDPWGLPTL